VLELGNIFCFLPCSTHSTMQSNMSAKVLFPKLSLMMLSSLAFGAINQSQVMARPVAWDGVSKSDIDAVMRRKGYPTSSFPYFEAVDGCGSGSNANTVPDSFGPVNFKEDCNNHDRCYMQAPGDENDRLKCDAALGKDALNSCLSHSVYGVPVPVPGCETAAATMYAAVTMLGRESYERSQKLQMQYEADIQNNKSLIETVSKPSEIVVKIRTGDLKNAGTDAKVFIKFKGEWASSGYIRLDNPNVDDFRRGTDSTFNLKLSMNPGSIQSVTIKHDNSGEKPGWFIQSIGITNITTGAGYSFLVDSWLSNEPGKNRTTCIGISQGSVYPFGLPPPSPGIIIIDPNYSYRGPTEACPAT
jgi:hypothetical protein